MKYKKENGNMIEMGLVIVGIIVSLILIIMALTGSNGENANAINGSASSYYYDTTASTAIQNTTKNNKTVENTTVNDADQKEIETLTSNSMQATETKK